MKYWFGLMSVCLITGGLSTSCSKKSNPVPKPPAISVAGTYEVIKDQGSDNGDTVYYTRTINNCEAAARFAFNSDHSFSLTSPCQNITGTWALNSTTKELVVTNTNGTTALDGIVEDETATGFIYDEIATSADNERFTFQKVN